ncbi:hypothetical protein GCM10010992_20760 [Cloacibacterium rupense]|uniref:Uncharacterized protein n=1 Tax=Cloacibacterium rupense TaxID=517423 RepID=A0ABQ2NKP3_9FLAO|nr:hypothetical protein [Cloacibacterium rupense]GGP05262.1 hypothetical protein GCM10010992_20760 [Cloacibacterium rupense]
MNNLQELNIYEFFENPRILCNEDYTYKNFSFEGIKLYDYIDLIPNELIEDTRLEKLPENISHSYLKDGKTYYVLNNLEKEYELTDRIKSVKENGGRLFSKSGIGYGINNGKVVEIILLEYKLNFFNDVNKNNISEIFGKFDAENEDYDYQHGALMNTLYKYLSRKLEIELDEWDNKVKLIKIGEELK